jgi:hypothetical protein
MWPRLYPVLSDKMTAVLSDLRNQLDMSARFCVTFVAASGVSALFLARHGWWLIVCPCMLLLALLANRAAVAAASAYGEAIEAAFDLHRFDMLQALHLPLPKDLKSELEANGDLTRFLRRPHEESYRHRHQLRLRARRRSDRRDSDHAPWRSPGPPASLACTAGRSPRARTEPVRADRPEHIGQQ